MKVSSSVITHGPSPSTHKKRNTEAKTIFSIVSEQHIAHIFSLFLLYFFMMIWKTEVQSSYQPISGRRTFRAATMHQTGPRVWADDWTRLSQVRIIYCYQLQALPHSMLGMHLSCAPLNVGYCICLKWVYSKLKKKKHIHTTSSDWFSKSLSSKAYLFSSIKYPIKSIGQISPGELQ